MQCNCRLQLVIGSIALALAPAPAFAIDEALLPRNLSPWGMFVGADIGLRRDR